MEGYIAAIGKGGLAEEHPYHVGWGSAAEVADGKLIGLDNEWPDMPDREDSLLIHNDEGQAPLLTWS